jgi:hypothetical protein
MSEALDRLIARLARLIGTATDALESVYPDGADAWQQVLSSQLRRYHAAAAMVGSGSEELTPALRTAIKSDLASQLTFLDRFAIEVKDGAEWQAGWNARAAMYADAIQVPYWRGATKMLPLPAMPGDGGSECLTRCRCSWDVQQLGGESNYDAYWRLGTAEQHCQQCQQRAADWNPVQVRAGILEL